MGWIISDCKRQMSVGTFSYSEGSKLMDELDSCLESVQTKIYAYIEHIKHERRERRQRYKKNRKDRKLLQNDSDILI